MHTCRLCRAWRTQENLQNFLREINGHYFFACLKYVPEKDYSPHHCHYHPFIPLHVESTLWTFIKSQHSKMNVSTKKLEKSTTVRRYCFAKLMQWNTYITRNLVNGPSAEFAAKKFKRSKDTLDELCRLYPVTQQYESYKCNECGQQVSEMDLDRHHSKHYAAIPLDINIYEHLIVSEGS